MEKHCNKYAWPAEVIQLFWPFVLALCANCLGTIDLADVARGAWQIAK